MVFFLMLCLFVNVIVLVVLYEDCLFVVLGDLAAIRCVKILIWSGNF